MSEPIPLAAAKGSYLATVSFWRMPDGEIRAALEDMPTHVIEDRASIQARFVNLSELCMSAAQSFLQQAVAFDPEEPTP